MSCLRLSQQIDDYIEKDFSSFHTPGHKGIGMLDIRQDITELPNLESLYADEGSIKTSEDLLSKIYGTGSIISASGSSLCIQAMLAVNCAAGDKVLTVRNLHRSAVNAMALLDVSPVWLYTKIDAETGLPQPVTKQDVEKSIEKHPEISAVYITSPDYYGQYADIKAIAAICKKNNKKLLVDCAHGAHFKFLKEDTYPVSLGADMCCASLHKTLPSLTGSAILSFSDQYNTKKVKQKMSIFASTSPSYLIMASIDRLLERLQTTAKHEISALVDYCESIKKSSSFLCLDGIDQTRITVDFTSMGYDYKMFEALLKSHKIMPEYIDGRYCVFIPSINNTKRDFERLASALGAGYINAENKNSNITVDYPRLEQALSVRKALLESQAIPIDTEESIGKIAGNIISPCPPGIPLVIPGERLDSHAVELLKRHGIYKIDVI